MMMHYTHLAACLLPIIAAFPTSDGHANPEVELPYASVIGSSLGSIDTFNGIPYAQPPLGDLRLRPPQAINASLGTINATGMPRACPQFVVPPAFSFVPTSALAELQTTRILSLPSSEGEDCLTINVQRPSTVTASSKLPVVFWIFGGGYEFGSTQPYNASELITASVKAGSPVLYVAVNYRVGGFGFLAGAEILADGASNLGLLDQRLGLQWVADNIARFGGDPTKVTIWGQSAGAISSFNQMALYGGNHTYKGKELFRAAIMDSGSVYPADNVDSVRAQSVYDQVVVNAGCAASSHTLACLRNVNFTTFQAATNSVVGLLGYNSIALSYLPRPDGNILPISPEDAAKTGLLAKVPFIIGSQEDEGTLFSQSQKYLNTTADLVNYMSKIIFVGATKSQVEELVATYPDDPAAGSPFGTQGLNQIYPQYKRTAAILGDWAFILNRRIVLNATSSINPTVPSWSYIATYAYGTPVVGTFHGADITRAYGYAPSFSSSSVMSYYISFFNYMDPNQHGSASAPQWPQWSEGKQLLNFGASNNTLLPDDFRNSSYNFLGAELGSFRL